MPLLNAAPRAYRGSAAPAGDPVFGSRIGLLASRLRAHATPLPTGFKFPAVQPFQPAIASRLGPRTPTRMDVALGHQTVEPPANLDLSSLGYGGGDGGGGSGGYDIGMDPGVMAAENAENLGMSELDAQLAEARRQAIIRFGDPALATEAGFGLDPQAATFAQQNYVSGNADLARIDQAHKLSRQAIINKLAGKGMLFSGDTGYLEGLEDQTYGQNTYDARNHVLDYLRSLTATYLDRKNALRGNRIAALQQAYEFGLANPGIYAGSGGSSGGAGSGGTGSGGGGTGGVDMNDFAWDITYNGNSAIEAGWSVNDIYAAAVANAPYNQTPWHIHRNGELVYQNGVPGVYIKYHDWNSGGSGNSIWIPLTAPQKAKPSLPGLKRGGARASRGGR